MTKITRGCPCCGAVLEIRVSQRNEWLACTRPGCSHKESLPVDLLLRRQGAAELPWLAEVATT